MNTHFLHKCAALCVAGLLLSADLSAATLYQDDKTRVDLWGRLWYGVRAGGQDTYKYEFSGNDLTATRTNETTQSEFTDLGSRIGIRVNHHLADDLDAFLRFELRGRADARNTVGFNQVRNTFVGLRHAELGEVQVGNFNSVLYNLVSSVFELSQDGVAHVALDSGVVASNGDSFQYTSPDLNGLKFYAAVKHLSGNGEVNPPRTDHSSSLSWHAGVSYTSGALYLAAAWNQSRHADADQSFTHDGRGAYKGGENLYGLVGSYQVTPAISARITYQKLADPLAQAQFTTDVSTMESLWGVGATWKHSAGEVYGNLFRAGMVNGVLDDQNHYVLGATYRVPQWPMFVFAEVYLKDAASSNDVRYAVLDELDVDPTYTLGLRYDF